MTLCLSRPGTTLENAYVESFSGKFRDECLNEDWFLNLVDAKATIEAWRIDYNTIRPHSSLADCMPQHVVQISPEGEPAAAGSPRSRAFNPVGLALSVKRTGGWVSGAKNYLRSWTLHPSTTSLGLAYRIGEDQTIRWYAPPVPSITSHEVGIRSAPLNRV